MIDMSKCSNPACDNEVPEGKKYCSKECYYKRFVLSPPIEDVVRLPEEELPSDYDAIEEQLEEEGIIIAGVSDEFCEVCGSPKYQGRCSRFTQHPAPKKPKSR